MVHSCSICLISSALATDTFDPLCIETGASISVGFHAVLVGDCNDSSLLITCWGVDAGLRLRLQVDDVDDCMNVGVSMLTRYTELPKYEGVGSASPTPSNVSTTVFFLLSFAFCAASCPACRSANEIAVGAAPTGGFVGSILLDDLERSAVAWAGLGVGVDMGLLFSLG